MAKMKTHKASAKRFRVTGGRHKQFMSRRATQDHFNARENGNTVRGKRRDKKIDRSNTKQLDILLPYIRRGRS